MGSGIGGAVGGTISGVGGAIGGVADGIGNTVGGVASGVGNGVGGVASGIGNTVGGTVSGAGEAINGRPRTETSRPATQWTSIPIYRSPVLIYNSVPSSAKVCVGATGYYYC